MQDSRSSSIIETRLGDIQFFNLTIQRELQLPAQQQQTSLRGRHCNLRSLESYTKDLRVKSGERYALALKNYNPQAKVWTLIMRSFSAKLKYLTVYCFQASADLSLDAIAEDLQHTVEFHDMSAEKKGDWIEMFSSFLDWRPSLSKASDKNRLRPETKIDSISTSRSHRSVIKFLRPTLPILEDSEATAVARGCVVSTLYQSHREEAWRTGQGFEQVGEYKIVNLDVDHQRDYVLLVGRNFFKRPMYAIVHCHGMGKNFNAGELEQALGSAVTVHKISRLHW